MNKRPDAVLIAGPTASGKSKLALDLADKYDGEIINTDSMQVYEVLEILTARPPVADLNRLPHHLYGYVPVTENHSVSKWLNDVELALADVAGRGKVPVFVGGTGLYFRTLLEGIAIVPDIPASVRDEVREQLRKCGADKLYEQLKSLDPIGAGILSAGDGQRIARALEVVRATGAPLHTFQSDSSVSLLNTYPNQEKILLLPDRTTLHERISLRTEAMFAAGAIDEVLQLLNSGIPEDRGVMRAIGVETVRNYLDGKFNINDCINKVKTSTRRYAKRQYTWFNNQFDDSWKKVF